MAAKLKVILKSDDKGTLGVNNYSYFRGKLKFIAIQREDYFQKWEEWGTAKWILEKSTDEKYGKMIKY